MTIPNSLPSPLPLPPNPPLQLPSSDPPAHRIMPSCLRLLSSPSHAHTRHRHAAHSWTRREARKGHNVQGTDTRGYKAHAAREGTRYSGHTGVHHTKGGGGGSDVRTTKRQLTEDKVGVITRLHAGAGKRTDEGRRDGGYIVQPQKKRPRMWTSRRGWTQLKDDDDDDDDDNDNDVRSPRFSNSQHT